MKKDDRKIEDRVVSIERRKISKKKDVDELISHMKEMYGVMNEKELLLDREFLNDMIKEIERKRELKLVYTKEYKNDELEKWRLKNARKETVRRIAAKLKEKKGG